MLLKSTQKSEVDLQNRNNEPNTIYNFEVWGKQIADFAAEFIDEPVVLCCNSVGGLAGLQAAREDKQHIKAVQVRDASWRLSYWLSKGDVHYLLQYSRNHDGYQKSTYVTHCVALIVQVLCSAFVILLVLVNISMSKNMLGIAVADSDSDIELLKIESVSWRCTTSPWECCILQSRAVFKNFTLPGSKSFWEPADLE